MIRVRRATAQDVPRAAEIYLRSRHSSVPAIPPLVHPDDEVRKWFAETVLDRSDLWVAEDDEAGVVGLMALADDWIEQLYVDPSRTGTGVGSAMLTVAKSLRPDGLQLWTFESNSGAGRFYESHGFVAREHTDGGRNEERAPDVRYVWHRQ